MELKLKSGKRTIVSVDQLKPYNERNPIFMPEEREPEELQKKNLKAPAQPVGLNQGGGVLKVLILQARSTTSKRTTTSKPSTSMTTRRQSNSSNSLRL